MRKQPGHIFWERLHRQAERKAFPLRCMFELTYRCNFRCPHCYVPPAHRRRTQELGTRQVYAVLDALCDAGCLYLGITGGEPFIRRDIFDILWYARKKGFQLIIYTNGSLIDKSCANRLRDLAPNKIDITIPGMNKKSFESVTKARGSYEKVFEAISLLHRRGLPLGFKACVLRQNAGQIPALRKFADSLGADLRLDAMLQRRLDGSGDPYRYRGNPAGDVAGGARVDEADCALPEKANVGRRLNLFSCKVGKSQLAINPSGQLKFCLMIDYPMIPLFTSQDQVAVNGARIGRRFRQGWLRIRKLAAQVRPDKGYQCPSCKFRRVCKWCPALGWLAEKNFTACDPDIKTWLEGKGV